MITLVEVKKAVNDVLKKTGYKVYGNEVKKGFFKPCFFVQIIPLSSDTLKRDTSENSMTIEIVYFSANKTELENLKMYDILKKSFFPTLQVKDRKILIRKFRAKTIESTNNIYSVRFDLNFYDEFNEDTQKTDLMGNLKLKL